MYDVGCTTEALGGAYVRRTMYDVRLRCSRALRGTVADGACLCTTYDVRRRRLARLCTTYDVRCTIAMFARAARDGVKIPAHERGAGAPGEWMN